MKRTLATRTAALLLAVPLSLTACSGGDVDADLPSVDVDGGNLDVQTPDVEVPDVDASFGADVDVDESPGLSPDLDELVRRARRLSSGDRALLGVTGAPGAGKSTLAARLVAALPEQSVLVPMDGFHLDDTELDRLGRRDRKGAPDTFDAAGYVHLLRRLRSPGEDVVYAPRFDREQEQAVAGAIAVPRDVPLVVTEGNYLLTGEAFAPVRALLDEVWFVDGDPDERRRRLLARHIAHGRTPEQAQQWVTATDEPNARRVEATRGAADLVVRVD